MSLRWKSAWLLLIALNIVHGQDRSIPASILPNITNLSQPEDFLNKLINNFRIPLLESATVATCGGSSNTHKTVWQNTEYPTVEPLPGLCTLTFTPPPNTCAVKIHFVDLALKPSFSAALSQSCTHETPSFKVSHEGGVTYPICNDATGSEGILGRSPDNTEDMVFVLQLDSSASFKFRVNVTAVPCESLRQFKSPNVCGIKNEVPPVARSALVEEREETHVEAKAEAVEDEREARGRKKEKEGSNKKRTTINKLKERKDIFSQALAIGLEKGKFEPTNDQVKILGTTTKIAEWPWMVAIERNAVVNFPFFDEPFAIPQPICAGVLLDELHVITTASCMRSFIPPISVTAANVRALIGDHDVTTGEDIASVNASISKISYPLDYDPFTFENDFAILQLETPVPFTSSIRPVCMPVSYNVFPRAEGVVTGWGTFVDVLRESEVDVLDEESCQSFVDLLLSFISLFLGIEPVSSDNFICVGNSVTGSPVCSDDQGTPLVRKDQTGAYFLKGLQTQINTCGLIVPNIFSQVDTSSVFLNVALA